MVVAHLTAGILLTAILAFRIILASDERPAPVRSPPTRRPDEFVVRRRWLDDRTYADFVGLRQFLLGPASSHPLA